MSEKCHKQTLQILSAGAWHKATNLCCTVGIPIRPYNGRTKTVGLVYNCGVRHDKPLPINSYTIVPILRVPVDIFNSDAVGR